MKLTPAPDAPSSSWESLRRQADLLGIPAWKLAEDNARHTDPEKLTFLDRVNKQQNLISTNTQIDCYKEVDYLNA